MVAINSLLPNALNPPRTCAEIMTLIRRHLAGEFFPFPDQVGSPITPINKGA